MAKSSATDGTTGKLETTLQRAVAARDRGALQDAETACRQVLGLAPENLQAHFILATVHEAAGQKKRAVEHYGHILRQKPDLLAAQVNCSVCLAELGCLPESLDLLASLGEAMPPAILKLHGDVLMQAKRFGDAAELFGKAASASGEPEHHEALAIALELAGKLDRAIEAYGDAIRQGGPEGDILVAMANLEFTRGCFDAGAEHIDAALAKNPQLPAAHLLRAAFLADKSSTSRRIEQACSAVKRLRYGGAPPNYSAPLEFALGRLHQFAGDDQTAFAHYAAGNAAQASQQADDSEQVSAQFQQLYQRFGTKSKRPGNTLEDIKLTPVFVFGLPRSGTTVVEQILASHPQAHGLGELSAMEWIARYVEDGGEERLDKAREAYLLAVGPLPPGTRWVVDKTLSAYRYVGLILALFPDARLIECRRHLLDTACSMYFQMFNDNELAFTTDLERMAKHFHLHNEMMTAWKRAFPDRIVEISYERLIADTEEQARRLCAHAGLPFDPACLAFHQQPGQVRTASLEQVRQPLHSRSIGVWRRFESQFAALRDDIADIVHNSQAKS